MEIRHIAEEHFYQDFLALIIELECGGHYDESNPQHIQWLKNRIQVFYLAKGHAIALYDEVTPVGFLFLVYDPGLEGVACFGKKATIVMLGLFPAYRSRGYARQLLSEAERYVCTQGCECIYVDTYARNSGAIRFYADNGYFPVAYHPYENGIDDKGQVYLCKELP